MIVESMLQQSEASPLLPWEVRVHRQSSSEGIIGMKTSTYGSGTRLGGVTSSGVWPVRELEWRSFKKKNVGLE